MSIVSTDLTADQATKLAQASYTASDVAFMQHMIVHHEQAVEMAVLLVPLVLLTFGAVEFGRAIYTFNALGKATRDAARHLSQQPPGEGAVEAQARCLAVHGDADCAGVPLAPGLTVAQVDVCDAVACAATHALQPTAAGPVNLVSVSIRGYTWDSVLGFIVPDLVLQPISVTMRGGQ